MESGPISKPGPFFDGSGHHLVNRGVNNLRWSAKNNIFTLFIQENAYLNPEKC